MTVGAGEAADEVAVATQYAPASTGTNAAPSHRCTLEIPFMPPFVREVLR